MHSRAYAYLCRHVPVCVCLCDCLCQRFLHVCVSCVYLYMLSICVCVRAHIGCHTLQHTATYCNTLQHTATYCNALQHTATHCFILQHTLQHAYWLLSFLGRSLSIAEQYKELKAQMSTNSGASGQPLFARSAGSMDRKLPKP